MQAKPFARQPAPHERGTIALAVATLLLAGAPALAQVASATATTAAATAAADATTVTVTGARDDDFRARTASVSGLDDASLLDTPASISVVNRALLDAQQAKLLSDVVRNDASITNAYAPVGFYQGFSIRGFPIDPASAIRIDGLTISGEQNVGFENKEQVEILKGLGGIDAGIVAPGGVINFVTKRPADVTSVTTDVDSRGSLSAAVDLGRRFGVDRQFGLRLNAASERLHSYVEGTDGHRLFASLAGDWVVDPSVTLALNAEFQHSSQRSASGYQLLGGTVVPTADSATTLLGAQSWARPVTTDALNLGARADFRLGDAWQGYVAAGRSHTMIDDNVAFAYGCYYVASCGAGGTSPTFFAANGDYDVYDYRSPDEYRRNDEVKAVLTGKLATGAIRHELTLGLGVQRRVVDMTDAVYDYVGTDNLYQPAIEFSPSPNSPSVSYPHLDARQYSAFGLDRIDFNEQWQLLVGGRELLLRQRSWASLGGDASITDKTRFLPQVAVVYKPVAPLSVYASYSKALSLGDQAPVRASNAYDYLPPVASSQVEAGVKYDWQQRLSLTATVFSIDKPFEFAQPDTSDAGYTFVQSGREVHRGIELAASGRATDRLTLTASATEIRARARDTGSVDYEGHQVINVPRFGAALFADYALAQVDGLHVQGGANYAGHKNANEEGTAGVPAYLIYNAGANYTTRLGGHRAVLRLTVDNLFNRLYWQDVGELLGDAYLVPGAPRTARASLTYDF